MIALSVRQPWASAILHLGKDIENRSWPMPAKYFGKKILLHTGKTKPRLGEWTGALYEHALTATPMPYGGVIGVLVFGASVRDHSSQWAEPGLWHWPIVEATPLPFYPCKGRLGFFNVDVAQ